MITFSVDELDNHQRNAYGTTAWAADYAGRNPVEGVNGMIKDDGSLNRASCRVFGLAAHTLAALMAAVVHNWSCSGFVDGFRLGDQGSILGCLVAPFVVGG